MTRWRFLVGLATASLLCRAAPSEVVCRERDGLVTVTTTHVAATFDPAAGGVCESLVYRGEDLAANAGNRRGVLAGTRLWKPEIVRLDDPWEWEVEKATADELVLHFWTQSRYFSRFDKRFTFRGDRAHIDMSLTLTRREEGLTAERYSLWTRNLFVGGGWTYWLPAREAGALLRPAEQKRGQEFMYDPVVPAVGAFRENGVGIVLLPTPQHLDAAYYWLAGPQFGTVELLHRNVELQAGASFTTGCRLLPVALDGLQPLDVPGEGVLRAIAREPGTRKVGRSNNPEKQRQAWLREPTFEGDALFVANYDGTLNAETQAGSVTPRLVEGKVEQVGDGRFDGAVRLGGGASRICYATENALDWRRRTVDAWLRADGQEGGWRHVFELPGAQRKAKRGMVVNGISLVLTPYRQLRAGIIDSKGHLHRAYRSQFAFKAGEWTHVRMVWDLEKPVAGVNYVELYVNGSNAGNTYGLADRPIPFEAQRDEFSIGRGFTGAIDAVKISGRAIGGDLTPERAIDYDAVSPEIRWFSPAPIEPIRALFIIDHHAARDVAHLKHLLPLEPTVVKFVYALKGDAVYSTMDDGTIRSHALFLDRLRLALLRDYDLIVTSPISWATHVPDDVQQRLVEKVRAGTGLFVVTPHDYARRPIADVLPLEEIPAPRAKRHALRKGSWRLTKSHGATRNVPLELFRPVDYLDYKPTSGHTLLATDGGLPLLQAAQEARGRVLVAAYNGQNRIRELDYFRAFGHLVPAGIFRKGEYAGPRTALLTYYHQLLVRCVLWAAGRRAPCELTFDNSLGRSLRLSIVCPRDAPRSAELWARFTTPFDLWTKELNAPLTLKPGSNNVDLALPFRLPDGKVKVDVIARSEAGVLALGTRVFELAGDGAIASLALGCPGYNSGETGRVTVTLDREPTRPVRCRLTVQDRYVRIGFAAETPLVRRQTEMTFETACLLPPWFRARAELLREDGSTLTIASVDGALGRKKEDLFGRYSFLTWGANDDQLPSTAGVASRAAKGPGALALAAKGANSMPYLWPDFRARDQALGDGRKARVPCLHDPAFLERTRAELSAQARYWRDYQPAAYMLADEVRFSPATYIYFEGCWGEHSLHAFRSWLKTEYAAIEQLNAQWGTDFATWDSVQPMTAAEVARSSATNFAAWADFRRFGELAFATYLDYCRQVVREAAPDGLTFLSGTVNPGVSNGHDWWGLLKSVDVVSPYRHGVQRELARSFAPYTGCISLPYAAGYGWTGGDLHYLMFKALLDQSEGINSWTSTLFYHPEGALSRSGKDTAEVDRVFRDGLWDYVRAFKRHTPVAVLYSMPSLRAAYARNELNAFENAVEGWAALLHDLCIGWRFVAPEQVRAGILATDDFDALVLPMCRSLANADLAATRSFIAAGGSVITEDYAGQMDEHCTPRGRGLVASLEPKAKGRVVVHALDIGQYRAIAEHYKELQIGPWQAQARALLNRARIRPFMEATVGRKPFHGYTANYCLGKTQLIIALPSPRMPVGDQATVAIRAPREAHLYLPLERRLLGRGHTASVSVRKGWPAIVVFAPTEAQTPEATVMPSRVRAGDPVEIRTIPRGQSHVPNALALRLSDPQGKALTHYNRILVPVERGQQSETITLALNETPGRHAVRTVDLLTGTRQEASFLVEARGSRE